MNGRAMVDSDIGRDVDEPREGHDENAHVNSVTGEP